MFLHGYGAAVAGSSQEAWGISSPCASKNADWSLNSNKLKIVSTIHSQYSATLCLFGYGWCTSCI